MTLHSHIFLIGCFPLWSSGRPSSGAGLSAPVPLPAGSQEGPAGRRGDRTQRGGGRRLGNVGNRGVTKARVWAGGAGGQDKGEGSGRGSYKLTLGEIARAQEDGSSGKTFPFVLEHLNVASGQGQRPGGNLSPKPVQPDPSPAQPGRLPAGRIVRNLPIAPSVSSGSPLGQTELLLGVQEPCPRPKLSSGGT